jgi:hypothetical protein
MWPEFAIPPRITPLKPAGVGGEGALIQFDDFNDNISKHNISFKN